MEQTGNKSRLRLILSLVTAGIVVPAVIALGVSVWDDRRFYIVSLLIIVASMVPMALRFERRRPASWWCLPQ